MAYIPDWELLCQAAVGTSCPAADIKHKLQDQLIKCWKDKFALGIIINCLESHKIAWSFISFKQVNTYFAPFGSLA